MKHITKILILFSAFALISGSGFGNVSDATKASEHASHILSKINLKFRANNQLFPLDYTEFKENDEIHAFIFKLQPQGFVIVSDIDDMYRVIGFSLENEFPNGNLYDHPVYTIIKGILLSQKNEIQKNKQITGYSQVKEDTVYGPHVMTLWGQVNCHNSQGQLINVTNYYTPNHYAVGCVALSLSTLLHYYNWPPAGEGYHQYFDAWGSSTGWYEANFGETHYKWGLMLDKYNNQVSTDEQREAAGELAFHAAVALEMNFEYNGSSANVNEIPSTGSNYFRFYSYYKQENSSIFWPRLDKNILEENPVILSVENNSGSGHSIVCDGLWINEDLERYYHLNMGWWGTGNGWFTIQDDFNASGYNTINGGVLDFIPKPYLHDIWIPTDTNMFNLTWQFTHTISPNAFEVQRKINNEAWETITDDFQDTSLLVIIGNLENDYYFRVRARVNEEWYPSSWSNTVQVKLITGISEPRIQTGVRLFPNPAGEFCIIEAPSGNDLIVSVRITDISGRTYYHSENEQPDIKTFVGLKSLGRGIYLAEILTYKSRQIIKFIKN
jgi:hypothetical protein